MFETLLQMWGQANSYPRFILIMGVSYPIIMGYVAWQFENISIENKKALIGGNRVRA